MEEGFSRLLLEIYSAAREAPIGTFEDQALKLVKPWLGFERSMWGTGVYTPIGLDIHNVYVHEEPEEMLLDYEEVKHQDPVGSEVFKCRGNTVRFHTPTLYQGRDKLGMLSLVKRYKHQNVLVTINPGNSNYCQWISLYRANPELQYSENERLLCESLAPHLMEALTINRVINMDRLGIKKRRYARGFFDRMGLLQFAEPLLTDLFQSEWPSSLSDLT